MNKLITNAEAKAQGIEDKVITQEDFDKWLRNPIHSKPTNEDIDEEERNEEVENYWGDYEERIETARKIYEMTPDL